MGRLVGRGLVGGLMDGCVGGLIRLRVETRFF